MSQVVLSAWEIQQAQNARNRARIMLILKSFPCGLTTQQIVAKEQETFGYTFLTDNRLRELRAMGWVTSEERSDKRLHWKASAP